MTKPAAENKIIEVIRSSSARLCPAENGGFRGIIDNRVKDPGGTAAVSAEERRRMKIGHWGSTLRRRAVTCEARAGRPA